jgi:hypothetical protein
MTADANGSGRSRGSPGSISLLALTHSLFSSIPDSGHFVYLKDPEYRWRLTLSVGVALVQGVPKRHKPFRTGRKEHEKDCTRNYCSTDCHALDV